MTDHVYKHIQLTGTSAHSIEQAVDNALARAARTVHSMRWFEVVETRGQVADGKTAQWQVTIRVGFTIDD